MDLSGFTAIVTADFEFDFGGRDGNLPRPLCMVAKELRSGKIWRVWRDERDGNSSNGENPHRDKPRRARIFQLALT